MLMQIYNDKNLNNFLYSSYPSAPEIRSISSDFDLPITTLPGLWIVSNYLGLFKKLLLSKLSHKQK